MCLILVVDKVKPPIEILDDANRVHPDGIGIAWFKSGVNNNVTFTKGLTPIEAKEIYESLTTKFVVHWRLTSVGGKVPELCHPFMIDSAVNPHAGVMVEDYASKVLFHNGHIGDWKNALVDNIIKQGYCPSGKEWSDSRALAWMLKDCESHEEYKKILQPFLSHNRFVIMEGGGKIRLFGNGWVKREGYWLSNDRHEMMNQFGFMDGSHHQRRRKKDDNDCGTFYCGY
jgi:hypothetical protein